ncbi:hypothetical protein BO223_02895 [Faecalibaculum rodentium]|uniref:Uncharacterized protein n=1 Tax=Faecalibaculum rodentium TaxID=1702221 RepID=A0A1Q9YM74_9FIRM|nr:hypothetical protein BO223_02895 [Faecalibaculum rodentium]
MLISIILTKPVSEQNRHPAKTVQHLLLQMCKSAEYRLRPQIKKGRKQQTTVCALPLIGIYRNGD